MISMMACSGLYAQKEETLAGKGGKIGGFGGPFFTYSQVGNLDGGGAGGGGGMIINGFFLGAFGQGEYFGKIRYDGADYDLGLGYGGLWIGFAAPSYKLIHGLFSLKAGAGAVTMSKRDNDDFDFDDDDFRDAAFVLHPEAGLELNLTHWFRMSGLVGYRSMRKINNIPTFANQDFSDMTLSLTLRFGKFGFSQER